MTPPNNLNEWLRGVSERLEKASPAPWRNDDGIIQFLDHNYDYPSEKYWSDIGKPSSTRDGINFWSRNAQLIAHAPTDLGIALRVIREMRASMMLCSGLCVFVQERIDAIVSEDK